MQQTKWLTIFAFIVLTGCQLSPEPPKAQVNISEYYLWIKNLEATELKHEIEKQLQFKQSGQKPNSLKLIMLHSLPSSPVHNPYTAKTQLNNLQLSSQMDIDLSTADIAFIVMLKDQLNQQLLQLEKVANYQGAYRQSKKVIAESQLKISELILQLTKLKQIERNISEREQ